MKAEDIEKFKELLGQAAMLGFFVQYTKPELECRGSTEFVEVRIPYNPNNKYRNPESEKYIMHYQLFTFLKQKGFEIEAVGVTPDGMGIVEFSRPISSEEE